MKEAKDMVWAIIGAGNGGQAVAGHLALNGYRVRIYDINTETIDTINKQGGIFLKGEEEGFGKTELATTDLEKVIKEADFIMIIAPATSHKNIARKCAPFICDNQIILLHPGSVFGAIEFMQILKEEECRANVIIAESHSLVYACRSEKPGESRILRIKERWWVSTIPAEKRDYVVDILKKIYPQTKGVNNILITSFENTNCIIHPVIMLLCLGYIESGNEWKFYADGTSISISRFIEEMDIERLNIAEALGIKEEILSLADQFKMSYGAKGDTLREIIHDTKGFLEIKGPKEINNRYITEDVPTGLVPLMSLGKALNIDVKRMELIIQLSEIILHSDFVATGRTMNSLGMGGMTASQIKEYATNG